MPERTTIAASPDEIHHYVGLTWEKVDDKFREIITSISKVDEKDQVKAVYVQYHHHLKLLTDEYRQERTSAEFLISLAIKYLIVTQNCLRELLGISNDKFRKDINELLHAIGSYISDLSKMQSEIFGYESERLEKSASEINISIEKMRKNQKSFLSSLEKNDEQLSELERKIINLTNENNNLDKLIREKMSTIENEFNQITAHLSQKKKEVDDVVGLITGKAVAGSYEISADEERTNADWLRGFAIFFMIMIVGLIGYTLLESAKPKFSIELAALRISFALILSIPAAYLARESAKHRQQQYTHLQTSLDLKAITPYIASLPFDTQNKLKEEMASRIFSQKNFDHITKEAYPINAQEILMAMIDKIGPQAKPQDDSKAD